MTRTTSLRRFRGIFAYVLMNLACKSAFSSAKITPLWSFELVSDPSHPLVGDQLEVATDFSHGLEFSSWCFQDAGSQVDQRVSGKDSERDYLHPTPLTHLVRF